MGGTSVRAGVVDTGGTIRDVLRANTADEESALEAAIGTMVGRLAERHPVGAVGLAVAGFVTPDRRGVRFAPHLPWRDVPVADRLAERCGLPVIVEHDTNAAALAEWRYGGAAGTGVMVFVALGTGIGGALLSDGHLFRGAHGVAPELGHLCVMPGGRACPCGKRGCWERYCSGTALVATLTELRQAASTGSPAPRPAAGSARITGREVAAAARDGDPFARRAMRELGTWLGDGLALLADVFDPDLVVVGGGVADSAGQFLGTARDRYALMLTGRGHRPQAEVRTARVGEHAGIVGAALVAREHLAAS